MKKRLLALCLAAALLLGMMPALTLSTNAADAVPDVKTLDFVSGPGNGYGYTAGTNVLYNANNLRFRQHGWSGTAKTIPDLVFDHTKEVLFRQRFHFTVDPALEGNITTESGNLAVTNAMAVVLMDADNGGSFLYYCLTGTGGTTYQIRFLDPNNNLVDFDLGIAKSVDFWLSICWNVDGTVTVLVNDIEVGTTESSVTWKVNPDADLGAKDRPQAQLSATEYTTEYDFITYAPSYSAGDIYIYDNATYPTTITTTEDLPEEPSDPSDPSEPSDPVEPEGPDELDGYFTAEDLFDDDALTEKSWDYAPFGKIGDYEAAVLVNKGNTYVALKGAPGDVDVTLDGKKVTATVNENGVAEVVFEGAVTAYSAALDMTVGDYLGTVTFASKAIDVTAEPTVKAYLDLHNYGTVTEGYNKNSSYWDLRANYKGHGYITSDKDRNLVLNNRQVSVYNFGVSISAGTLPVGSVTVDKATSQISVSNAYLVTLKDKETGNFLYAYVTNSAAGTLQIGFLNPDGETSVYLPLGEAAGGLTDITLYWYPDGSVSVACGGIDKGKVSGVTWTADSNKVGTAYNPTADKSSNATECDFIRFDAQVATRSFLLTKDYTNANFSASKIESIKPYTTVCYVYVDLPSLKDDLKDDIEAAINTSDLVSLPDVIEHPYLGTVALTWSDSENLVSNNRVTVPGTDTRTKLTAMVGSEEVWTGEALVKAIATNVDAIFTVEPMAADNMLVEASWNKAGFVRLNDIYTAVLVNKGVAYVALKSATAQTAKVTLGDTATDVTFVNGVAEVAFDDLDITAYGDTRTLTVGEATVTVTFTAKQIRITPTAVDILENLPDGYPAYDMYRNGTENYLRIKATQTTTAYGIWGKSGEYGDVVINRDYAVRINWNMSFQAGFFIDEKVSWTLVSNMLTPSASNVVQITFKDYESNTFVNAFLTAGDGNKVYLGIISNEAGNAGNEYVDLGLNATEAVDLSNLYLIWNTDGSVTVLLGNEVKGTVQNATWTPSGNVGRSTNPSVNGGTTATTYDFARMYTNTSGGDNQGYFAGLSFTYPESVEVVDIDTELNKQIGFSVDLGADIGLNFIVSEDAGATITVNAAGKETVYSADKLPVEDGKYLIEAFVAAAQMTEDIAVTIVDAHGFTRFDDTITVKDYLNVLQNDPKKYELDEADLTLIADMLDYGAAAQAYFGHYTEVPAVDNIVTTGNLANESAADYPFVKADDLPDIELLSAALRLEEKVVIRYYFEAASVDGMTFTCSNGATLKAEQMSEGVWYVDVDVNPQNMGTMYTVTVNAADDTGSLTVTYSCMNYLINMLAATAEKEFDREAEFITLLNAMYDYYKAAAVVKPAN